MVRFGAEEDNEFILKMTGLDNPLDECIIRGAVDEYSGKTRYSALLEGEPRALFIVKGDTGVLYPLGANKEIPVEYSEEWSLKYYPDYFLTDYLYQAKEKSRAVS